MKEYLRYVFGVLAVILVIILFIVGFNMIRKVVRQSDKPTTPAAQQAAAKSTSLTTEYSGQPLVYTIKGAVNGNEEHYSIRTTVTPSTRRVEVLRGYNNEIIKTQDTPNTMDAYKAFATALDGAGFTKKANSNKDHGIEDQSCLLGRRYSYEASPTNTNPFYSWSTSCGGSFGTFGGNRTLVEQLFQRQIPNYETVVRGIRLS